MKPAKTALGRELVDPYLTSCYAAFLRGDSEPAPPVELLSGLSEQERGELAEAIALLKERASRPRKPKRARENPRKAQSPADQVAKLPSVPGFEVVAFHREGAFGRVYHARSSKHFQLEAAVKVLKTETEGGTDGMTPSARLKAELLVEESVILAHLNHPHVIRYLASGFVETAGNELAPFVATQFIDGESLEERIQHKPQDPRWSARVIERVADALHAAHQLRVATHTDDVAQVGILHRDVKPSNIMLGPGDHPYLTDFGLAGRVGRRSTQDGFVAGTPRFAAPEQIRGDSRLDATVDVYGLGATLYSMLVGAPPGAEKAAESRARPPIDLMRICQKCLATRPADRYPTAAAVRDDLERYLAGRPVLAHPLGPIGRLNRWARRQPRTAALVLLLIAAGLLVVALLGTISVRETSRANAERAFRKHEEELANAGLRALDFTVNIVIPDSKFANSVPAKVRKQVAVDVIPEYNRLIELQADNTAARASRAKATLMRARLRHAIGTPEEDQLAIADCLESARFYALAPPTPENRFGRARALRAVTAIIGPMGRLEDAIKYLDEARDDLATLIDSDPTRGDYRFELAMCLANKGNCQRYLERFQEAQATYEKSIEQFQRMVKLEPGIPRNREWLSRVWGNLADLSQARDDLDATARLRLLGRAAQEALQVASALNRDHPDVKSIENCLMAALLNHGAYRHVVGDYAGAAGEFEQAARIYDKAHRDYPDELEYRWGQATARGSLGTALLDAGKTDQARATLEESAAIYAELTRDYPQIPLIAEEKAKIHEAQARLKTAPARPAVPVKP